jgi:hypothetical protein
MAYEDLLKDTSESFENGNYFNVTITDLALTDVADAYPIQFRWKYKDGTFSNWSAVKNVEVPAIELAAPSDPSTPTVRPVLGAIEVSWNGKTSTGANQSNQSDYAKIYIGTSSSFTPADSGPSANFVDVLDFANNNNSVYLGVDTVVNGSLTISYDVDYYIKIVAFNRAGDASSAVAATGNPVRVGKVSNSGIITVTADKIATGTLSSSSTITVGSTSGKHVIIRGTGNPLEVFGSGGTVAGAILSFDTNGDLSIKGTITATAGEFSGYMSAGSMKIGTNVNSTNDGLYMGTDNYWYNTGVFKVGTTDKNMTWDGTDLTITGTVNATSGYIGSDTDGWLITDDGALISISNSATISMINGGNIFLSSDIVISSTGSSFQIKDFIAGTNILTTDSTNGGRVYLGDESGRQVEVAKSAQVAGTANVNSGGLRNMYTITQGGFTADSSVYLTDRSSNGDVLLVWTS